MSSGHGFDILSFVGPQLVLLSSAGVLFHLALCYRYSGVGDVIGEGVYLTPIARDQLFSVMAAEAVAVNQSTGQIQVTVDESISGTSSLCAQDRASADNTNTADNGTICLLIVSAK